MLTIKQVAEALNVSTITIVRRLYSGVIKGVKVGNRWRISAEEVERIKREGI